MKIIEEGKAQPVLSTPAVEWWVGQVVMCVQCEGSIEFTQDDTEISQGLVRVNCPTKNCPNALSLIWVGGEETVMYPGRAILQLN